MRTFFRYWLPVVLWVAVITTASTDLFSAQHTGSVIEKIITVVLGHPLPADEFDPFHFVIRKLAHLTEYAILGALAYRAVRGDSRGWNPRWAAAAIVIAALVASSDEFHQSFVPSRGPSPVDVLIDTIGATVAQGIVYVWLRSRREEKLKIEN